VSNCRGARAERNSANACYFFKSLLNTLVFQLALSTSHFDKNEFRSGARLCRLLTESVATSLPLLMNDDLFAGLLDFREDVRAQDNRVVASEALDQVARLVDLLGVESGGGLVQDEHVRIVKDGLRQADALPVALR